MAKDHKVQCDYKQILIDSFESNGISVQVYVLNNKGSVKKYCKDTYDYKEKRPWLSFKEGLRLFEQGGVKLIQ